MNQYDFATMPGDLIREDFWLGMLFKKGEFYVQKTSIVYTTPRTLESYLRYTARLDVGLVQMKNDYPVLYERWLEEFGCSGNLTKTFRNRLGNMDGMYNRIKILIRSMIIGVVKL